MCSDNKFYIYIKDNCTGKCPGITRKDIEKFYFVFTEEQIIIDNSEMCNNNISIFVEFKWVDK